jgi:hypothetical protein
MNIFGGVIYPQVEDAPTGIIVAENRTVAGISQVAIAEFWEIDDWEL